MHFALVFVFALFAGVLGEQLMSKYENVDVETILKNDRLLKSYIDCLLDKGKCTAQGAELKKRAYETLDRGCDNCTEKQLDGVRKVIKYLTENKRDWWNELVLKFDPHGVYRKKYKDLLKQENINL